MATTSLNKDNKIRIGDIITLKFPKYQSYLSAEGILVEDVGVSSSTKLFEEHLFQIYVQRQYSATNELEEFTKYYQDDMETSDPSTKNHYEALLRGKENEAKLNLNVMKNKTGNLLCFGDIIQLLHVKSKKFITVKEITAKDERENMQIKLSSDGSVLSWIKVLPRYKINREGDVISNNLEIILRISERANEYVHCADRKPPKMKLREVNSALEKTPWKINTYLRADEITDAKLLLAGQLVYIRDPESQSLLSPIAKPLNINRDVVHQHHHKATAQNTPFRASTGSSSDLHPDDKRNTILSPSSNSFVDEDNISLSSLDEFIRDNGQVGLKVNVDDDFCTDSIWMMESKVIHKGGVVKFRTDQVHFRNLNTGKYLAVEPNHDEPDRYVLALVSETSEKYTLFSVNELNSTADYLSNGKAMQIRHNHYGIYLERGTYSDSQKLYSCSTTRNKTKAVNIIVSRYQKEKVPANNTSNSALDIYFGKSVIQTISKFVKYTAVPTNAHNSNPETTLWPKIEVTDRPLFSTTMARTALFLRGYPILLDNVDLSTFKADKHLIKSRQDMLREQGLIQDVMILLNILQFVSSAVVDVTVAKMPIMTFIEHCKEVVSECLNLLFDLIKQNLENQIYIADNLLVILAHVSSDKMAAQVAQELLSSNRELQETKIGLKEITVFAEKMREIPMSSMYLELLKTCCACLGQSVPKNQEIVQSVLFRKYQDILISMDVKDITVSPAEWSNGTNYFDLFIAQSSKDSTLASSLIFKGFPSITLKWVTKSTRYSSQRLFQNKIDVPIQDIFRTHHVAALKARAQSKQQLAQLAAVEHKKAVADFFIAQLQLCAEICLGRNYPVMSELESSYRYDALVTIVRNSSNDGLKSAAVHLILNLYVDRDPQNEVPLPRLTRTWTETSKDVDIAFVSVASNRKNYFSLLQYVIAFHLDNIRGKAFLAHSYNLMKLLQKLVDFHFYGDIAKLKLTIEQLVSCLKRDEQDLNPLPTTSNTFISSKNAAIHNSNSNFGINSKKVPVIKPPAVSTRGILSKIPSALLGLDEDEEDEEKGSTGQLKSSQSILNQVSNVSEEFNRLNSSSYLDAQMDTSTQLLTVWEGIGNSLLFVILAIGSVVVGIYLNITIDDVTIRAFFKFIIIFIFAFEFFTHMLLYVIDKKEILGFVKNIFNILALLSIGIFVVVEFLFGSEYGVVAFLSRIAHLIYLIRAYHLKKLEEESSNASKHKWVEPVRYFKSTEYTLTTIIKIIQILCSIQRNIEDRNLSLFLRSFYAWNEDNKSTLDRAAFIFEQVINNGKVVRISNEESDYIFVELLMYSNGSLVQNALELLMQHHSSSKILMDNISKLQLITSSQGEAQYVRMDSILKVLKTDADTHDIWGKLNDNHDRQISADMLSYLSELTNNCKKPRTILQFDEAEEPVIATQNILRNLGCFDVCMKIVNLVSSIDRNDSFKECHFNTLQICVTCNKLLFWFLLDNPANQQLAFNHLHFFIKTIDSKISSQLVIKAMFRNNLSLIEQVPKKYIGDFVNLICTNGRFPQYLTLMSSIIAVGEKNVIGNQYEVIKLLSSPENIKKIVQFFVPVTHPEYQRKIKLLHPFHDTLNISVEDLPMDLAYHLELMKLLSGCAIGTSGMTTIEAKVQSMYNFVDIVEAMMDTNCLILARTRLALFFYNAMIDVETPTPNLKDADCIWKFIISTQDIFSFGRDDLRQIEKNGWDHPESNRQKIEYMLVCVMIIRGYFSDYYDVSIFKQEVGSKSGVERVQIKEVTANEIMKSIYLKILAIYEMVSPVLQLEHHLLLHSTCEVLNNACASKIVSQVEKFHERFLIESNDFEFNPDLKIEKRFKEFVDELKSSEVVKKLIENQTSDFISILEKLPLTSDVTASSDVRFEPLIEKLVAHVTQSIQIISHGDEPVKFIASNATSTGLWIVNQFRSMIENKWGMNIFERDEDGGEEQDLVVKELVEIFNKTKMVEMCLDLIARGIDLKLQVEAMKLLVAMLFKEGGAIEIQKSIYAHLSKSGSELFFRNIRYILQNLIAWHKWNGIVEVKENEEPILPDEIIVIRCLQLFCEGHFEPNQNIVREQPNNSISINLLDDFVMYLQSLDLLKCRTSTVAELKVAATILEVIQGPCEGNQDYFALNTELIETLNRMIRQRPVNDCDESEEIELKKSAIDIFQGLLEGQGNKTAIYERMLSVIHIDVIQVLCSGNDELNGDEQINNENNNSNNNINIDKVVEESEEAIELRTESLVLMQMLTDFRPTLRKELNLDDEDTDGTKASSANSLNDSVACVELVWRGELQRRFFHVPDICCALAKSTKDHFIANVRRHSPEDKLYGLLAASKEMYREILHQNTLNYYGLDKICSRTALDRITWTSFYVVLALNVLFIFSYSANYNCPEIIYLNEYYANQAGPEICPSIVKLNNHIIRNVTNALIYLLIFLSFCSVVMYFIVRVPVNYRTYIENGKGVFWSILYTARDAMTLYYLIYLGLALYGAVEHAVLSILLLDFILKSPTAQGVLKAVYNPRKQIFMTLVLTGIILYIFSFYEFFFFSNNANFAVEKDAESLANLFRFLSRWGLPYGSPQNYMEFTISSYRVIVDLAFFVATQVMLNIIKGITIDTFVDLRKSLEARLQDTTEKCFICGIDKNTFNRKLDRNAFRVHTKIDQNLWNYVYFIIFIWEQSKDDDDGLETYVRRCIDANDLAWFPMNKAIRLADHQRKGDVHSLKYRFRKDLDDAGNYVESRMNIFKEQLNRTIIRVEKAVEYEPEFESKKSRGAFTRQQKRSTDNPTQTNIPSSIINSQILQSKSTSRIDTPIPNNPNKNEEYDDNDSINYDQSVEKRLTTSPLSPQTIAESKRELNSRDGRDRVPHEDEVLPFTSALDADTKSQMHVRLVALTGLKINQSQVSNIIIRLSSELGEDVFAPLPTLEEIEIKISTKKTRKGSVVIGGNRGSYVPTTPRNPMVNNLMSNDNNNNNNTDKNMNYDVRDALLSPLRNKNGPKLSEEVEEGIQHNNFMTSPRVTSPGAEDANGPRRRASLVDNIASQIKGIAASFYVNPTPTNDNTNNNFSIQPSMKLPPIKQPYIYEKSTLLKFDVNASPVLLHEGMMPKTDLSKIIIKIQVLFCVNKDALDNIHNNSHNYDWMNTHCKFLGEKKSQSRAKPNQKKIVDNIHHIIEASKCIVSVSPIASPALLKEWNAV
eukprot:gene7796-10591_t